MAPVRLSRLRVGRLSHWVSQLLQLMLLYIGMDTFLPCMPWPDPSTLCLAPLKPRCLRVSQGHLLHDLKGLLKLTTFDHAGCAFLVGGLVHHTQRFAADSARTMCSLLVRIYVLASPPLCLHVAEASMVWLTQTVLLHPP